MALINRREAVAGLFSFVGWAATGFGLSRSKKEPDEPVVFSNCGNMYRFHDMYDENGRPFQLKLSMLQDVERHTDENGKYYWIGRELRGYISTSEDSSHSYDLKYNLSNVAGCRAMINELVRLEHKMMHQDGFFKHNPYDIVYESLVALLDWRARLLVEINRLEKAPAQAKRRLPW